jgi:hypothetical protein
MRLTAFKGLEKAQSRGDFQGSHTFFRELTTSAGLAAHLKALCPLIHNIYVLQRLKVLKVKNSRLKVIKNTCF